ncbi:MAG: hypothetical protein HYU41_24500 [Candidatus Rokubacteria bacterium]|nr:hypothetical protein [Candidatus Rokubacteria bacterium]
MSRTGVERREAARSLQQAASTIFVLMGLMPFLIFLYAAHLLGAINDLRVQLALALALAISMLGFAVLLTTMRKTSAALQMLVKAEMPRYAAPRAPGAAAEAPPAPKPAAERTSSSPVQMGASTKASAAAAADIAPAIGQIKELRDAAEAVGRRWRAEAERLMGRAVRVGVQNFDQPETGILSRITDDGLILEQAGQEFGVLWRFVSSIELFAAEEPEPVGQPG